MAIVSTFRLPVQIGNFREIYVDIKDETEGQKVVSHPKAQNLAKEILLVIEELKKDRTFINYFTELSTFEPGLRNIRVLVNIEYLGETSAAVVRVLRSGMQIVLNEKVCFMYFDENYQVDRTIVHEVTHFLHRAENPQFDKRIDSIRKWAAKRAKTEGKEAEIMEERIMSPKFDTDYETLVKFFTYFLYHLVSEGIAWYAGECERKVTHKDYALALKGVDEMKRLREEYVEFEKTGNMGYAKVGQHLFDKLIGDYVYYIGAHMVDTIISSGLAGLDVLVRINENQFVLLYEEACARKGVSPLISLQRGNEITSAFDFNYTLKKLFQARKSKQ